MNAKWVFGNNKLEKTSGGKYRVVGWGIPADVNVQQDGALFNTCPAALACRAVCYAKQGTYRFKNVVDARRHNLDLSLNDNFADSIIADLSTMVVKGPKCRKPYNVVRLHDSGDFYSQRYLDAWCTVARAYPDVVFYAYTKSMHLNYSAIPANLRITQSFGGKHDALIDTSRPHSRIFSDDAARIAAGYIDGNVDDTPAIEGTVLIGLVYHGGRKLTDSQKKYFSLPVI